MIDRSQHPSQTPHRSLLTAQRTPLAKATIFTICAVPGVCSMRILPRFSFAENREWRLVRTAEHGSYQEAVLEHEEELIVPALQVLQHDSVIEYSRTKGGEREWMLLPMSPKAPPFCLSLPRPKQARISSQSSPSLSTFSSRFRNAARTCKFTMCM